MAKRRPPLFVEQNLADLKFAFFISHVGEDAAAVAQVKAAIEARSGRGGRPGLACFLDVHTWPFGNENIGVIKEFLLKSAFMIAWVSPQYLATTRGWVWVELAFANLIEISRNRPWGYPRHPFIAPVFLPGVTVNHLERTPLLDYWQRKLLLTTREISTEEIAHKLVDFYEQEFRKLHSET